MERVISAFMESGLPGALCVALSLVVYFLWSEGKAERNNNTTLRVAQEKLHLDFQKEWEKQYRELELARVADLRSAHQARVADAELVHDKMLEVVKQCTTVLSTTAASLDTHKDATIEHRDAQKEAAEELRKLSTLLVSLHEEVRSRKVRT
jgi:predicted component of type VI protein secretion system